MVLNTRKTISISCLTLLGGLVASLTGLPAATAHPPPFYRMPDLSMDSQAGLEVVVGRSDLVLGSATLAEASAFFHLALGPHITILGRVPFSYVDYEPLDLLDVSISSWALGNASIGVQLGTVSRLGRGQRIRYGLGILGYVPTASDEGEEGAAAQITGAFDVPDPGRFLVNTTTLRARGDLRYETGAVFLQGELALDHHIQDAEDRTHLLGGVGVGFMLSHYVALLGELTLRSEILEDGDDLIPVLDAGLRYHNPSMMLGLRVYWPFDEAYRDADVIGLGLDLAVRF